MRSYQLAKKLNNDSFLLHSSTGLGSVYNAKKEWETARDYVRQAISLAQKYQVKIYFNKLNNLMGMTYSNTEKVDSAHYYFNGILNRAIEDNDSMLMGYAYNNIANLYMTQRKYVEAIDLLNKSKNISTMQLNPRGYSSILANIGECKLKLNELEEASEYLIESNAIAVSQNFMAIAMMN